MALACECSVNSEHFIVHIRRLTDAKVIVCFEREAEITVVLKCYSNRGVLIYGSNSGKVLNKGTASRFVSGCKFVACHLLARGIHIGTFYRYSATKTFTQSTLSKGILVSFIFSRHQASNLSWSTSLGENSQ